MRGRIAVGFGFALSAVGSATSPHASFAEDAKAESPARLDAKAAEALRLRCVEAYKALPRFHERLSVSKTRNGTRSPPTFVEIYRESPWLAVLMTQEDPTADESARPDPAFGLYAYVSDGLEVRVLQRGEIIGRLPGQIVWQRDREPMSRALAEVSKDLARPIAAPEPFRTEPSIGLKVSDDNNFGMSITAYVNPHVLPNWFSEGLWSRAEVTLDATKGRVSLRGPGIAWIVRTADGGLDGWDAKHPNGDCVCWARAIAPATTPEQWRQRIQAACARVSKVAPSIEYEAPFCAAMLREAIEDVMKAAPRVVDDAKALERVTATLVRGLLSLRPLVERRPNTFEATSPLVRWAAEGAAGEDATRRATLVAALEKSLRAALAAGAGSTAPPANPK